MPLILRARKFVGIFIAQSGTSHEKSSFVQINIVWKRASAQTENSYSRQRPPKVVALTFSWPRARSGAARPGGRSLTLQNSCRKVVHTGRHSMKFPYSV